MPITPKPTTGIHGATVNKGTVAVAPSQPQNPAAGTVTGAAAIPSAAVADANVALQDLKEHYDKVVCST